MSRNVGTTPPLPPDKTRPTGLPASRDKPPAATVIARRPSVGHVQIADVRCPWGHTHTIGLAATTTAELWCSYGSGTYTVTIQEPTP